MMRRSVESNLLNFQSGVAAFLSWLLVICLPVGIGFTIYKVFPVGQVIIAWIGGIATFAVCFFFAEGIWRVLRWILTWGKGGQPIKRVQRIEEYVADLISSVLSDRQIRYSYIIRKWPVSENLLVQEAFTLLQECENKNQDNFDQSQINRHLRELSDVLNKLRLQ